jgi:ribosomal protein S20
MLSYGLSMPNTKSAAKAVRSSATKYVHNQSWKKKIKDVTKNMLGLLQKKDQNADILNKELSMVAKTLDKAAKEKCYS